MKIIACIILSFLTTVSVFAQKAASYTGGSVFSCPGTGATMILTNNTAPVIRWIHVYTNSPSDLLLMVLPWPLAATNTATRKTDGTMLTNTMSWVTCTNALALVAGGGTTNGFAFIKLGPGYFYQFDYENPCYGGVIGVSLQAGQQATGETGDMK